jgi:hypothetical protein
MKFDMDANQNYGTAVHQPYQCFMGRWEGLCKTFDAQGNFIESSAVHMNVYWIDEKRWHLHEYFENLYEFGAADIHSDITVDGKYCFGKNEVVSIEGAEITPYNYVFTIVSQLSGTTVYNNHYFLDPNNRRIITHKVRDNATHIYQIQDFVRIVQP